MAVAPVVTLDGVKAASDDHVVLVNLDVTDQYVLLGIVIDSDTEEVSAVLPTGGVGPFTRLGSRQTAGFPTVEVWGGMGTAFLAHFTVLLTASRAITYTVGIYSDVDETNPVTAVDYNAATSTTPIMIQGSSSGDMVVDFLGIGGSATLTVTVGSGQTERWRELSANKNGLGSTEPGNTTVTMSWTLNLSRPWNLILVNLQNAGGDSVAGACDFTIPITMAVIGDTRANTAEVELQIPITLAIVAGAYTVQAAIDFQIPITLSAIGRVNALIHSTTADGTASGKVPDRLEP